jgi:hypothetical protein
VTLEMMKALTDDDLRAAIDYAQTELKERDRQRKEQALQQAKAILAQAGLSLSELSKLKIKGNNKATHAGMIFTNPANPAQVYEPGKGRPPGWFTKHGGKPVASKANQTSDADKKAG